MNDIFRPRPQEQNFVMVLFVVAIFYIVKRFNLVSIENEFGINEFEK
jgi:hypothetical protein